MPYLLAVRRPGAAVVVGFSAKCGCTSVKEWCLKASGVELAAPEDGGWVHDSEALRALRLSRAGADRALALDPATTRVLVYRDPYARLVSAYVNRVVRHPDKRVEYAGRPGFDTFEQFVDMLEERGLDAAVAFDAHHFEPQSRGDGDWTADEKRFRWDVLVPTEYINERFNAEVVSRAPGLLPPMGFGEHLVHRTNYLEERDASPAWAIGVEEMRRRFGDRPSWDRSTWNKGRAPPWRSFYKRAPENPSPAEPSCLSLGRPASPPRRCARAEAGGPPPAPQPPAGARRPRAVRGGLRVPRGPRRLLPGPLGAAAVSPSLRRSARRRRARRSWTRRSCP